MSDDEMMLNIVQSSSKTIDFDDGDDEFVKSNKNKRKREGFQKEPANKRRKFNQTSQQPKSTLNLPTKNTNKQKESNIRGKLSKDLSVTKQTKQEIAEKTKEIFEESTKGFEIINERMKQNLEKHLNITKPTKIQLKSLQPILDRNDM